MSDGSQAARSRLESAWIGCLAAICVVGIAAVLFIALKGFPGIVTVRNDTPSDLSNVVVTAGRYMTSADNVARGRSTRLAVWPRSDGHVEVRYSIDGVERTALCGFLETWTVDEWVKTQTVAITTTTTARFFEDGRGEGEAAVVK